MTLALSPRGALTVTSAVEAKLQPVAEVSAQTLAQLEAYMTSLLQPAARSPVGPYVAHLVERLQAVLQEAAQWVGTEANDEHYAEVAAAAFTRAEHAVEAGLSRQISPGTAVAMYHAQTRVQAEAKEAAVARSDAALVQASAQPNHLTCNPDLPVQTRTRTRPQPRLRSQPLGHVPGARVAPTLSPWPPCRVFAGDRRCARGAFRLDALPLVSAR